MSRTGLVRLLVAALVLALLGWVIVHTRWEEVQVDDPARGAAATDEYYSLRQVLAGAGATLTVRTSLEPLPPADATLLLESGLVDSLSAVDVALAIEKEFGVKIPPSEIDLHLESVHTLAQYVAEQRKA